MSTYPTTLEARAARHAALADPLRLRIVDMLAMSDYSPTEIERHLGVSSNLLAHHLRQLEDVGLVSRSRSEADRRRTYVRLEVAMVVRRESLPVVSAPRVVFVCTGNSARSQLAVALWTSRSEVPGASVGTNPAPSVAPGAIATAYRHGLELVAASPRGLEGVLRDDDLMVTVCDSAHEQLRALSALHWSIPDPVPVGTDAAFDAAFASLVERIGDLAQHVRYSHPLATQGAQS